MGNDRKICPSKPASVNSVTNFLQSTTTFHTQVNMSDTNYVAELVATARAISAPGKGILAADESTGTIGKRFAGINVEVSPNKFVLLIKFDF